MKRIAAVFLLVATAAILLFAVTHEKTYPLLSGLSYLGAMVIGILGLVLLEHAYRRSSEIPAE